MADYPYLRVNKKNISIDNKNGFQAKINWEYLNASMEYALSLSIIDIEIMSFIRQFNPPYVSNIMNKELIYSSYYASEEKCSDIFPILLPQTEEGIGRVCHRILKFLNERYLKCTYHVMEVSNQLIDDILEYPTFYAFPFLTVFYVIKKNRLNRTDIDLEFLLNEKSLKVAFNTAIAQQLVKE